MTRVDFVVDSDHDPAMSRVIYSLAELVRAISTATMDCKADFNHVNGLPGAASILADQLTSRLFLERSPAETEPGTAAASEASAFATGGAGHG